MMEAFRGGDSGRLRKEANEDGDEATLGYVDRGGALSRMDTCLRSSRSPQGDLTKTALSQLCCEVTDGVWAKTEMTNLVPCTTWCKL